MTYFPTTGRSQLGMMRMDELTNTIFGSMPEFTTGNNSTAIGYLSTTGNDNTVIRTNNLTIPDHEIVSSQTDVDEDEAKKILLKFNGDIVNSIMFLISDVNYHNFKRKCLGLSTKSAPTEDDFTEINKEYTIWDRYRPGGKKYLKAKEDVESLGLTVKN